MRFFLFLLLPLLTNGQDKKDTSFLKTRNIIWTVPVAKNTTINGLAIGLSPITRRKTKQLHINGVVVSVNPFDPFIGIYSLFDAAYSFSKDTSLSLRNTSFNTNNLYSDSAKTGVHINGLMIGTSTNINTEFDGIDISIIMNTAQKMHGLALSGLFNHHYSFTGVLIAGIRNKTTTEKGVQIALFNSCKEGKVVQIGLINKIGKRVIPFFNCAL